MIVKDVQQAKVLMLNTLHIRIAVILVTSTAILHTHGAELQAISLPAPNVSGGKPLMDCLSNRRTTRQFKGADLPAQELSNLLWAGFGVNRPQTGHRTAPSAMNSQEIDLYVLRQDGVYIYDAKANALKPLMAGDFRKRTNGQDYLAQVPVVLLYVAELPRMEKAKADTRPFYAGFDAGCVCQNVYLYCASAGLATVVYDLNRAPLAKALSLKPEQQIIMAQAVGYPPETPVGQ